MAHPGARGWTFFLDRGLLSWPANVASSRRGSLLHELVVRLEAAFPHVDVRIGSASNNNPWSGSVQRVLSFIETEWPVICRRCTPDPTWRPIVSGPSEPRRAARPRAPVVSTARRRPELPLAEAESA
jgi:hypothetical protein